MVFHLQKFNSISCLISPSFICHLHYLPTFSQGVLYLPVPEVWLAWPSRGRHPYCQTSGQWRRWCSLRPPPADPPVIVQAQSDPRFRLMVSNVKACYAGKNATKEYANIQDYKYKPCSIVKKKHNETENKQWYSS